MQIVIYLNSRYIAVIYDVIMHTAEQLQWQNFGQIYPNGRAMGCLSWIIQRKRPRYIERTVLRRHTLPLLDQVATDTLALWQFDGRLIITTQSYQFRDSHYRDMTLLRPTYFYNWNNHTQKDSLYIETGPWFTAKKGRFMIHGQACSILRVITFKLLVGVTEHVFLTVCRISIFWGRTYVHGNKASVESLWKHWDLWHVVEDLPCNSLIPRICGCNPTLMIFIIYICIYICIYIYIFVCVLIYCGLPSGEVPTVD